MEQSKRIEHLYHAAREREPGQRSAFLQEACDGDESLRQEVESLLAGEDGLKNFLEHSPFGDSVRVLAKDLSQSWIGRKLGPYEIMSLLGEGGMGEVYLAQDLSLRREVALKVFSTNVMTDPNHLDRFKEEARLASSLNHPNIVTIYGVGEEGDVTFIAMELVRGRTLREVLESGRIPLRRALDLAFQICDALAAAHASGIVHRDLKPENVMVTPDERVKVLDFGLAKKHGAFLSEARTAEGTILGTVGYMSPEQATGKPAIYTADQFSLGAILYEMVTGRRAFAGETPMDTLSAILRDQPPATRSVNPEVPASVEQIIDRCLAKDPSQRYSDTHRLAQDILAARDGSLDLTPPSTLPISRRRAIWVAGSSVAAAVVAAAGWELWPRDAGIRSLAVLPFKTASADEDSGFLSILVADSLSRHIANVKSLKVVRGNASLTPPTESADAMSLGRLLHVDGVVSGTIGRQAGRVYITVELTRVRTGLLWHETFDEAESNLLVLNEKIAQNIVSLGMRLKLSDEERTRFVRYGTDNWEAAELYARALSHQDQEQEEDYVTAGDLLEKAIGKDPRFPLAYVALARNHTIMAVDGYRRPSEMWPEVYRYTRTALDLDPTLLEANSGLAAEAFYFRWNWQTAEQEYKTTWSAPVNGQQMGWVLLRWALRRYDDALDLVRQARRDQPLSLMWRLREAALLTQMGKIEEGAGFYEEIMNDQAADARAYFGLAEARRAEKRFGEAIDLIRKGSELDAEGDLPPPLEDALSSARSAEGYDRVQKALAQLELNSLRGRSAEGYVSPLDFARAHSRLGNKEEALKYLGAALKEPSPGVVFINVDQAWNNLRTDPRFNAAIKQIGLP